MSDDDEIMYYAAMRDAVDLRHGIYFMFATVLFFQVVNWKLKSQGPPKSLKHEDYEWEWRNIYISWIHAVITSTWVTTSILLYPEMFANLIEHVNYVTFFGVCFSTGYFLYDLLDGVVNNEKSTKYEIVFHHVVVICMFYYNIHYKIYVAFNIVALLVEINSIFLHWRRLLQMVKTPYDSRQYLIVKYLNLGTFIVCRGCVQTLISASCCFLRHKMTYWYSVALTANTFLFDILTLVLLRRLLISDIFRGAKDWRPSSVCAKIKRDWSIIINGHAGHSNGHVKMDNGVSNGFIKES